MQSYHRLLGGSALWIMAAMAVPAYAQVVSSSIRGEVVSSTDGSPVVGAVVEVLDTRTNAKNTSTIGGDGFFNATNLDVGGPYTITVTAAGYKKSETKNIAIVLGEPFRLLVALEAEVAVTEKVTVVGARNPAIDSRGVGAQFNQTAIRDFPVIDRDFKEIVQQTPLAFVNYGQGARPLSIASSNPRCNNFQVDGLPQNDNFGLNDQGYPTARAPLPIDWAKQIQIAVTPYDTQYNDFCGGVINVVTKSGSNEFHGSLYYNFTDQDLRGSKQARNKPIKTDFAEEQFGATLSGPIIEDTLFFFVGYDRVLRPQELTVRPYDDANPGDPTNILGVRQVDIDQVLAIARDPARYNFDPLALTDSFTEDNTRWIGKLSWQINDEHRADVTYQESEGGTISTRSTRGNSTNAPVLGLPSNWYVDAEKLKAYTAQIFSDWTSEFSTQLRYGHEKVIGEQVPLGGTNFPEIYIRTPGINNVYEAGAGSDDGFIAIGPDQFRQFNFLEYTFDTYKATFEYEFGRHLLKGGYDRKETVVINGFAEGASGIYRFDSIAAFGTGDLATVQDNRLSAGGGRLPIRYGSAPSSDPADATIEFDYTIDSFFLQDDWDITDALSVMAGLRYDYYTSEKAPQLNPQIDAVYDPIYGAGFNNQATLDGRDIFLPRMSFKYIWEHEGDSDLEVVIRGGIGRFSGGNPNVWVANNYTNSGVNYREVTGLPSQVIAGVGTLPPAGFVGDPVGGVSNANCPAGYGVNYQLFPVPQCLQDILAAGGTAPTVNLLDPNFKIPSLWRANLSADATLWGWDTTVEYLRMEANDQLYLVDLRLTQSAALSPDGRKRYDTTPGAVASGGTRDLMLSNASVGRADYFVIATKNEWDFEDGLGDFGVNFGYVHSIVTDLGFGTSSRAISNYQNRAWVNINDAEEGTSDFERRHRFTFGTKIGYSFIDNLATRLSLFGTRVSGQPFSYTYRNDPFIASSAQSRTGSALLYVPTIDPATGLFNDPKVVFDAPATQTNFLAFVNQTGLNAYAGQIAPRNAFTTDWVSRVDLGLEQEIELFDDHRATFEFNIFNLGNLLNRKWGTQWGANFNSGVTRGVINGAINGAGTQYTYSGLSALNPATEPNQARFPSSLWQMQVGMRYEF